MTCADVRERLDDLVEERLERADGAAALPQGAIGAGGRPMPADLAEIDRHLTTCAECRQELVRLEQTVGLLRAVEPPRAPAGFVDRVLEAVRPPWYRRLARTLLWPLHVKLPLEAAAILLVSLGVVYVFQRTPELQEAARLEPDAPVVSRRLPETGPDARSPATPPPLERPAPREPDEDRPRRSEEAARDEERARAFADRVPRAPSEPPGPRPQSTPADGRQPAHEAAPLVARRKPAEAGAPPAPAPTGNTETALETTERRPARETNDAAGQRPLERLAPAPPSATPPSSVRPSSPPAAAPPAPATVPGPSRATADSPRTPDAMAKADAAGPHIRGRLSVADLEDAERRVRDLAARHGGAATGRRADGDRAVVLEVAIAGRASADLVRGLAELGRWTPEPHVSPLPDRIRLEIRLER